MNKDNDIETIRVENDQLCDKAKVIIDEAGKLDVPVRMFGGASIWLINPRLHKWLLERGRKLKDIDLFTFTEYRDKLKTKLLEQNYREEKLSPIISLYRSIYLSDGIKVEVQYDKLRYCHELDLRNIRFTHDYVLNLGCLLLSKLQIANLAEVDFYDIWVILTELVGLAYDNLKEEEEYICNALSKSWGFFHTFELNCNKLKEFYLNGNLCSKNTGDINYLEELLKKVEAKTKPLSWKLRSIIGEKVKWYKEVN